MRNIIVSNITSKLLLLAVREGVVNIDSEDLMIRSVQEELSTEVSDNTELVNTSIHSKNLISEAPVQGCSYAASSYASYV